MAGIKQIHADKWAEHCSLFTNGNKGRMVTITSLDNETGNLILAENSPLMAFDYDPIKKGDDMVISLGKDTLEYSHTIQAPIEFWETHDDSGEVTSIEIIDQMDNKVIVTFN